MKEYLKRLYAFKEHLEKLPALKECQEKLPALKTHIKKLPIVMNKIWTSIKAVPAIKYYTVGVLGFSLLFRFGNYASGGDSVYIRMGDVNGDGIVSTSDVFSLAGLVAQGAGAEHERFTSADMNSDGRLSPADVFSLIRLIGGSESEITFAESVELSAEDVTLYVGNHNAETTLTAEVLPDDAAIKDIVWSSTDESVVTVEDGRLTAVGEGEAYVVATSGDGAASSICLVRVGVGVTSVEFSAPEIYITEDSAPILLSPAIYPENATNRSLVWDSSDWDIVSVDSMGGITPRGIGTAVIGASSLEGDITASCTVHVLAADTIAEQENAPDISIQRMQESGVFTNYLPLSRTLDSMLDIQCGFYNISSRSLSTLAEPAEVAEYVNPANYSEGDAKYQFLDLSVPNNMTADELNEYLSGKGILSGMGQAFIDAANEYGVSEAYLVAHACLETGNGTSQLSTGVSHEGTTVYNMFGIGAYDGNALRGGASYAYSQGWTTPEAAIKGGAKWIAENYIYRNNGRQNTLYKMRWNPLSPGSHQYATDVGWAVKQAYIIANIIGDSDCLQIFEIPVYSGTYTGYIPALSPQTEPDITQPTDQELTDQTLTEQSSAEQVSPEQSLTEQSSTEQTPTEQIPAEQTSAEQTSPEQSSTEQVSPEQSSAEQASTEQSSTEQPSGEQSSTEQTSPEQATTEQVLPVQAPAETPAPAETEPTAGEENDL